MITECVPRCKKSEILPYRWKKPIEKDDILEFWENQHSKKENFLGSTICTYEWPLFLCLENKIPKIFMCNYNKPALLEKTFINRIAYEDGFGKTPDDECDILMWDCYQKTYGQQNDYFHWIKWCKPPTKEEGIL